MTGIERAHAIFRERRLDAGQRIHSIETHEGVFITHCDVNDEDGPVQIIVPDGL